MENFEKWRQEMSAERCKTLSDRCDVYVTLACWIKTYFTRFVATVKMTPFELLFGSKPRTPLDSLFPLLEDSKQRGNLAILGNKESKTF